MEDYAHNTVSGFLSQKIPCQNIFKVLKEKKLLKNFTQQEVPLWHDGMGSLFAAQDSGSITGLA